MSRFSFFVWHGLFLCMGLILPKVLKAHLLAADSAWGALPSLVMPDLLSVLALEAIAFGLASVSGSRAGRWMRALWGLLLFPLLWFMVAEHRFFLASGSMLDWALFSHAIVHAGELTGLVQSELSPGWWVLLVMPLPLAVASAIAGGRRQTVEPVRRPAALGMSMAGMATVFATGWWGGMSQADPRLSVLEGSTFLTLGADAVRMSQARDEVEEDMRAAASYALPEPVQLEAVPESRLDNVVFIILESARADATTPYTPALDTMPFLDRVARTGLKVDRGYTVLPHTTKSLVPILCGIEPDIRQALSEPVLGALPVPCLPRLLEPLGYSSAFFQAAFARFEQRKELIADAGFKFFVAREQIKTNGWQSPNYFGVEDRALLEPVMKWVDGQKQPFFLTVLTLISHHDYKVPSTFVKKQYPGEQRWSDYLNTLRYTDQFLEELWAQFESRGLLDRTLFVFIGDHGEGHGEHARKGHDEILYEEGIRVPYILWSRNLLPIPQVVGGLRQNIDLLPTVADLLELKVAKGAFRGRSLLEPVEDRTLFLSCWYEDRCLGRLTGDQKILYNYGRRPVEVYDLAKDPGERTNLASSIPLETLTRHIDEMKAWKHDRRELYVAQRLANGRGFVFLEPPKVDHAVDAAFNRGVSVVGYNLSGPLEVGKSATLEVFFQVRANLGWHSRFQLELKGPTGTIKQLKVTSSESQHPLYTWVPGQYMKLELKFRVPPGVRSGDGVLHLSMMRKKERTRVKGADVDSEVRAVAIPVLIKG